jgi:EAL domain-containing protein (putative c-di-GMP-specific phosphodiesterase class I)
MYSSADLRKAIETGQLRMLYQPQMTSDGTRMASVESLVRWQHPVHGLLGPGHFIPLAEKTNLIVELGAEVLRQSCIDGLRWPNISVGVNVSPLQFRDPTFPERVEAIVRETGLPFERLELEIVESSYFDDPDKAGLMLTRLRDLGVRIALDDFGTGYSSLSCLLRLPLDKIKIDRSFVAGVDTVRSASIVHAIIALARAIGLKITAEGIETEDQQRFLRAAGVHFLQGYLYAAPVPVQMIDHLTRQTEPIRYVA